MMLLLIKKGTKIHVNFGRIYIVLMLITATIFNHFGWIHRFSFLTVYTVPTAKKSQKQAELNHKK